MNQNIEPVTETKKEKKLTIAPTTLAKEQLLHILQRTPKEHIYKRPAKGGGTWEYVTGTYVKKVLNYVFGWKWDFEVKEYSEKGGTIFVLGRLTVKLSDGSTITKEQFGRADIKKKKDGDYLDYGNDLKSATTDSLKKCASELGIASDIYGAEEFKEIKRDQFADVELPKPTQNQSGSGGGDGGSSAGGDGNDARPVTVIDPLDLSGELARKREKLKGNTNE